ncbi:MAG: hypothetical protein WCJ13_09290, partial [Coriobacteriia bacterium]
KLVTATLLGRLPVLFDEDTGEILDGPVSVSVYEYRDGVELTAVPRTGRHKGRSTSDTELRQYENDLRDFGPEEAKQRAEERRAGRVGRSSEESVRRGKGRVRRLVRYYGLTLMVTLTFPGVGVHDYNESLRLVQNFIHDHGELLHLGGHYVAVPELHPSGHGWHWHVLVRRRFTRNELRAVREGWTAYLGRRGMHPSGGAKSVRVNLKDWQTGAVAAGYASKYVGKTFEQAHLGKNRRRFLASQGAVVEAMRATAESLEQVQEIARSVPGGAVKWVEGEGGRPPMVWAGWDH